MAASSSNTRPRAPHHTPVIVHTGRFLASRFGAGAALFLCGVSVVWLVVFALNAVALTRGL